MRFEGKDIEIRPLDNLNTRKETQDMSDLEFIGYYDLFTEFYEGIDDMDDEGDRYKAIDRVQNIASILFKENPNLSKDILDSVNRKKDLREKILDYAKNNDNDKLELFLNLKEKTSELRESFKKDIHVFLENFAQQNDVEYDMEKINYLIENINIKFSTYKIEDINKNIASHISIHFIRFNLDNKLKDFNYFKKVFYHEFLHVLSSDYEKIISFKDKNNNEDNIGWQSTGLRFLGLNNDRFEWLNEAVTEKLAMSLTKIIESKSYTKERQLLDLLDKKKKQESKIDFNLLIKIYFRNIQKRQEINTSEVYDWREFSKEIDKAFGDRFLVKLDLFIEKKGITKAIEVISLWPDGQPNIDDLNIGIT